MDIDEFLFRFENVGVEVNADFKEIQEIDYEQHDAIDQLDRNNKNLIKLNASQSEAHINKASFLLWDHILDLQAQKIFLAEKTLAQLTTHINSIATFINNATCFPDENGLFFIILNTLDPPNTTIFNNQNFTSETPIKPIYQTPLSTIKQKKQRQSKRKHIKKLPHQIQQTPTRVYPRVNVPAVVIPPPAATQQLILSPISAITPTPDETLYCVCSKVSYGDMIGCDNNDCSIEWFHLACVGLLKPPTGAWHCSSCSEKLIKKFL